MCCRSSRDGWPAATSTSRISGSVIRNAIVDLPFSSRRRLKRRRVVRLAAASRPIATSAMEFSE